MNVFSNLPSLNDLLEEDDDNNQPNYGLLNTNLNHDSPYIMIKDLKDFQNLTGHFSIININARSISKHYIELVALLNKSKVDCLVVTETWLTLNNIEFWNFNGYQSYHHPRLHATHGGVSIFVKESIQSEEVPLATITNEIIECKAIKIKLSNYTLNILGIYTPPQSSRTLFIDSLENILTQLGNNGDTLLTGDFNLDLLKLRNDANCLRLYNSLISQSYHPVITRATHPNATTINSSLLDQTWLKSSKSCKSAVIINKIADHFPTIVTFQVNSPNGTQTKVFSRPDNFVKRNNFIQLISNTNFNFSLDSSLSADTKFEKLHQIISQHYNESFPITSKLLSKKRLDNPWLTDALLKSISQKDNLYKLSKAGIIPEYLFKNFRNILNRTLKKSKEMYYENKFTEANSSPKTHWKLINEVLNKSKKNNGFPAHLNIDGAVTNDTEVILNTMNTYFSKVGSVTASKIPHTNTTFNSYLTDTHLNNFQFSQITPAEVKTLLNKLENKGCDTSTVPNKILKLVSEHISIPLSHIFNACLNQGIFPTILKKAKITPIHKAGDKAEAGNYRPISILPTLSKLLEKLVHNQATNFLERFKLLQENQFGFQKNNTTCDAITHTLEILYSNLNRKLDSLIFMLDFSKAFDTISIAILLAKLEYYGFRGTSLDFFRSYLTGRSHFMKKGDFVSKDAHTTHGVPQGSILGPLLFILYINDINNCHSSPSSLYADDSTLIITGKSKEEIQNKANEQLAGVRTWLNANKVCLNLSKTSYMVISNKTAIRQHDFDIKIDDSPINRTSSTKILGLILDDHLSFKQHINNVTIKVSKFLYIMYKLRNHFPTKVAMSLYYSLVYPHLLYCITAWGNTHNYILKPLEVLQRKIILHLHKIYNTRSSTSPLFKEANLLKLRDIYKLSSAIYVYKINNHLSPNIIRNHIYGNQHDHQYNTRQPANYFQRANSVLISSSKAFSYSGVDVWNRNVPENIKNKTSLVTFKKHLKSYFISNY